MFLFGLHENQTPEKLLKTLKKIEGCKVQFILYYKLENIIYVYRKHGFNEVFVESNCHYKRCDIKMELVF